jgi:hypothetical protein
MNSELPGGEGGMGMTKSERDDLVRLIKQRERIAKTAAAQRSAQMLADFERQISAVHAFDSNEVWEAAMAAGVKAAHEAQARLDEESKRLGIPEEFRPRMSFGWMSRGQNAFAERRSELRKVALAEINAAEKSAHVQIETQSVAAQTKIIAHGLSSDDALRFFNSLPPVQEMMPALSLETIQAEIARRARGSGARLSLA